MSSCYVQLAETPQQDSYSRATGTTPSGLDKFVATCTHKLLGLLSHCTLADIIPAEAFSRSPNTSSTQPVSIALVLLPLPWKLDTQTPLRHWDAGAAVHTRGTYIHSSPHFKQLSRSNSTGWNSGCVHTLRVWGEFLFLGPQLQMHATRHGHSV